MYSCQPVSLSNPLSSAELTIQKFCLLSDSISQCIVGSRGGGGGG